VRKFNPRVLAAIERYRVTVLKAVSTQFVMLLNSPAATAHDLSSLRAMFTGGGGLRAGRVRGAHRCEGAAVLRSNETGAVGTTPDDPLDPAPHRGPGSRQVRLLDPETDADIPIPAAPAFPRWPHAVSRLLGRPAANERLLTTDG
jgi:acyl-CoA synthetase